MTPQALTKQYKHLGPEERFRLILAASGRGDGVEKERLLQSGGRLSLSVADHMPWSQAFSDISLFQYIELLDDAGRYLEMFARADQPEEDAEVDDEERWADTTVDELTSDVEAMVAEAAKEKDPRPGGGFNERYLRIALATGFMLRTKTAGWQLFCERLHLPPFLLWEGLPGYHRLQVAIDLAKGAAFTEKGFLRWLNELRPKSDPEITKSPITVEGVAGANEHVYRERSHYWRG